MILPDTKRVRFIVLLFLVLSRRELVCNAASAGEKPAQFWNLTAQTVTLLQLAPAGTGHYGPNLCLNDKDKSVDHDERLKIPGLETGTFDIKIGAAQGPVCTVKGIKIEAGKVFSIEDKDLIECKK